MLSKTPATLTHFIAWLETQDPETEYDWSSTTKCVFAQYGETLGLSLTDLRREMGPDFNRDGHKIARKYVNIGASYPNTFGAALARARSEA